MWNRIAERDAIIRQREQTIRDREAVVLEREALVAELEREIARLRSVPPVPTASIGYGDADPLVDLARWPPIAATFRDTPLPGSQALIEPYIIERQLYTERCRILIANQEGRAWYDKVASQGEIALVLSAGMVRRGDTVFDCGANQGVHSLMYSAAVGSAGTVLGFDPFPLNVAIGTFNAALNRRDNIAFVQSGVGSREERVVVSTGQQCTAAVDDQQGDAIEIALVPLDNYAHLRPDYLKIDVEGAEVEALAGASKILATRPALYIEIHPQFLPRFGRKPMDVLTYIDPDHYTLYIKQGAGKAADYDRTVEITAPCAICAVPRHRPPIVRYSLTGAS